MLWHPRLRWHSRPHLRARVGDAVERPATKLPALASGGRRWTQSKPSIRRCRAPALLHPAVGEVADQGLALFQVLVAIDCGAVRDRLLDCVPFRFEVVPDDPMCGRVLGAQLHQLGYMVQRAVALLSRRGREIDEGSRNMRCWPLFSAPAPAKWSTGSSCQRTSSGGRS